MGGYHAISRPFWFTGFTESGNGGVSQHRATAEAQQGVTENPHNSKLQIAEDINVQTGKTPYNLSNSSGEEEVENTANCYLVNARASIHSRWFTAMESRTGISIPLLIISRISRITSINRFLIHISIIILNVILPMLSCSGKTRRIW